MIPPNPPSGISPLAQRSKGRDSGTPLARTLCSGDRRKAAVERRGGRLDGAWAGSGCGPGLSTVHICSSTVHICSQGPSEPRHYRDVLSELGAEEGPRLGMRRCRDFNAWRVEWANGGNFVRFRGKRHTGPAVGGDRGKIYGFSRQSRRRLMEKINSVDRRQVDPRHLWMVTLTYPGEFSSDPRRWKRDLKAFGDRLRRAFGPMVVLWKLEFQRRGAPHFHLIMLANASVLDFGIDQFKPWVSRGWYEVVGSGDERHLRAGTKVELIRSWEGVGSYAGKYLAKDDSDAMVQTLVNRETGELASIGRVWGVWNEELWPVSKSEKFLPDKAVQHVRRVIRRYVEHRGSRHRTLKSYQPCAAFVPGDITARLVSYEINAYGQDRYQAWRKRRGWPETVDPHQDYFDWMLECSAEYSKWKRDNGELAETVHIAPDADYCPNCGLAAQGATDHCDSCGWSVLAEPVDVRAANTEFSEIDNFST